MEWIVNNWFIIVLLGLVGAIFIFGRGTGRRQDGDPHDHQHGTDDAKRSDKSSHGCCH